MNKNLLKNTLLASVMAVALVGCKSDVEEGFDYGYNASKPAEFSTLKVTIVENAASETGDIVRVDLMQGATSDGEPLTAESTSAIVRSVQFDLDALAVLDPRTGTGNNSRSAFRMVGNYLYINLAMFADALQAGGSLPQHTFIIDYIIDNGAILAEGETLQTRRLELTIAGSPDPVEGVEVPSELTVAVDGELQAMASVLPAYAFNKNLIWQSSDSDIISVDPASGVLRGIKEGTVTITVTTEEGGFSDTFTANATNAPRNVALMNVYSKDGLEVTSSQNGQSNQNGQVTVPACTAIGFEAMSTPEAGKQLAGDFVYNWSTGLDSVNNINNGEMVYFSSEVTGPYVAGVSLSGTAFEADIDVMVEANLACNNSNHSIDLNFDDDGKFTRWGVQPIVEWATITHDENGLTGKALSFTRNVSDADKMLDAGQITQFGDVLGIIAFDWAKGTANGGASFFGSHFGLGTAPANPSIASVGKEIKAGIWVKLIKQDPSDTTPVVVKHHLLPWSAASVIGPNRPPKRLVSPDFTGVIPADKHDQWVYIEFVDQQHDDDDATFNSTFTIPASWGENNDGSGWINVQPEFLFEGLAEGDTILIDDYAIQHVNAN
ncbi:Ig-like domain-containing protein [Saccharobesus litoralis]|nr:Ig-like domain-containing protein [Saccharobesus litoralis]